MGAPALYYRETDGHVDFVDELVERTTWYQLCREYQQAVVVKPDVEQFEDVRMRASPVHCDFLEDFCDHERLDFVQRDLVPRVLAAICNIKTLVDTFKRAVSQQFVAVLHVLVFRILGKRLALQGFEQRL